MNGFLLLTLLASTATGDLHIESLFPFHPLHNHSSSIVELPDGELFAVWYRGSGEGGADDVQIMGARKSPGGAWSAPFVTADTPDLPDLNPVVFLDPQQQLWLFYATFLDNSSTGVLMKYCRTKNYNGDGPVVWEKQNVFHCRPRNFEDRYGALLEEIAVARADDIKQNEKLRRICEQQKELAKTKIGRRLGWMSRTVPIMVDENRMMLGLYHDVFACSITACTEDGGDTWSFSEPIQDVYLGGLQPAFGLRSNGTLVAFMRDNGKPKQIRTSESRDKGITWTTVVPIEIANPGSSVAVLQLKSGAWILVCNDLKKGRHRLTVFLSEDEGRTWPVRRVLEDIGEGNGEVHYPSSIQTADGSIHLTYTYSNPGPRSETIKHAWFDEPWIRAK